MENTLTEFAISYDESDRERIHDLWAKVFDSGQWTEGAMTDRFEELWSKWNGLPSVAFSGWSGGALAALDWIGVEGETVLCPSNTFMATPLSVLHSGADVRFVDCNREDLSMSYDDLVDKIERHDPKAVWLVHVGGHIAFEVEEIAEYCADHDIWLLEDCAHAHGAEWNGRRPGTWGDAGVYSFYATKTVSTGEGGMLVSEHEELIDHARQFRNYGKFDYDVHGLNFRMNEFTAALGCVQLERMPDIVEWKRTYAEEVLDPQFSNRVEFPDGMRSGYYKYIVFDPIEDSTGKVYDEPCHRILDHDVDLPNTDWVADNHWCVPIYYHGDTHAPTGEPIENPENNL